MNIPITISARHLHLNQEDLEKLFGPGYQLKKERDLVQPKEFASQETISLQGPKAKLDKVRIVGPIRKKSQVEISKTDAWRLGIEAPVRLSGDLANSASLTLIGPAGEVNMPEGVIVPQRHIHCSTDQAQEHGLADKQIVSVQLKGERGLIFQQVMVRVADNYQWEMHIDTDEANAAGLEPGTEGIILKDEN